VKGHASCPKHRFLPQKDLLPLLFQSDGEGGDDAQKLLNLLAEELDVQAENILSYDLNAYPYEQGCLLGCEDVFLSSPRLDNLSSVKACLDALRDFDGDGIRVAAFFDNEEVGSRTKQGAGSMALAMILERVYDVIGLERREYLAKILEGFCLSVDVAHALHPNAPEKATEGGNKRMGQVAKQSGFRLETVFTDLAQAARKLPDDERQPLRTTWEILAQLYADSLYWQSLERLVGLEVYSQERWKRLALRWFFTYCVTQAKPIAALNDAKSYLNHLLQPGRNTRQAFEHYAQTQYEADCRAWQHYRQMQGKGAADGSNAASKP